MIVQLTKGISKLDELAYTFASKQRIKLEDIVFDGGVILLDRDLHTVELRCNGTKKVVQLTTEEIRNCSIAAQHKIVMALMHFVPHPASTGYSVRQG